jgi:hypothetical protein
MDINNLYYIQSDHNLINIDADCKNKTTQANSDENKKKNSNNKKSLRKDNMFNRLKTRLIEYFIRDLYERNNEKKKGENFIVDKENGDEKLEENGEIKNINEEKKGKGKKQTIKEDKKFLNTSFEEIDFDKIKKLKNTNIIQKFNKLIKMRKRRYLKWIMKNKDRRKKFFNDEKHDQIKRCKNDKCRYLAYRIIETKNLKGMILLTKLTKPDRTKYIKIKKAENFMGAFKKLDDYKEFNLKLTSSDKQKINERIKIFKSLAKEPFTYLANKKRGRKPKNQK